jgi:hypothetical protein
MLPVLCGWENKQGKLNISIECLFEHWPFTFRIFIVYVKLLVMSRVLVTIYGVLASMIGFIAPYIFI